MQQLRNRWKLSAGVLLLVSLYLVLAGVQRGTATRLSAPPVSSNTQAPGGSSQLHQVTLHITGMS
jgi:hypothetical protein